MLALQEKRHKDACELYRELLSVADETGEHILLRTFSRAEWAVAELRRGRRDVARHCLCSALRAALGEQSGMMPIGVLPPSALWLATEGQAERAVEVYALALRYPYVAHSRWYRDVFGARLEAASGTLPPEVIQARDLQATVRELLDELACGDGS
jgi:hypothetical protein